MNAAVLVERLREAESDGEIDLVVISSWVTDTAADFIETVDRLHQPVRVKGAMPTTVNDDDLACKTCGQDEPWPCATRLALNPTGGNAR